MKSVPYIFAFLFLGFTLNSQAQAVDATLDFARFKATDSTSFIEFYCAVDAGTVVYKKLDKNKYQAEVALNIEIADSAGVRYFEKMVMKSPVQKDEKASNSVFTLQKRMLVRNGNYNISWHLNDLNSKADEVVVDSPVEVIFNTKDVSISDIQLLEKYEASAAKNDYTKHGYSLISYVSDFYPQNLNKISFFSEIYHTDKIAGVGEPIVVFYKLVSTAQGNPVVAGGSSRQKAAAVNLLLAELDLSIVPSGNYELVVDVRDQKNQQLAQKSRFIQRSNPQQVAEIDEKLLSEDAAGTFAAKIKDSELTGYLLAHLPISNSVEQSFIEALAKSSDANKKRNYIYHFWHRKNELQAESLWLEYKRRIDFVNRTYSNKTFKGYESDRGRVYLQYGPPSIVHNERTDVRRPAQNTDTRPYEIWKYYSLASQSQNTPNQSNREFVFIQRNLGNNNYDLLHSDALGEMNNPNWRSEVGQKFSGNPEFDRNAGRNFNE